MPYPGRQFPRYHGPTECRRFSRPGQGGVGGEDPLVHLLQFASRLGAELVDQDLPGGGVGGERLGLTAVAVKREHQLSVQALP